MLVAEKGDVLTSASPFMAKKKSSEYSVTLQLGNDLYSGTGGTALEALHSLPKPDKIMLSGILTVSQGDRKFTQRFWPARLKRLFYSKPFQEVQVKYFVMGMK